MRDTYESLQEEGYDHMRDRYESLQMRDISA